MESTQGFEQGRIDSEDSGMRSKAAFDIAMSLLAFATCSLCVPYLNPRLRSAHGFRFVQIGIDSEDSGMRSKAAFDIAMSLLAFATCSLCVPYLNPRLRSAHGFRFV